MTSCFLGFDCFFDGLGFVLISALLASSKLSDRSDTGFAFTFPWTSPGTSLGDR